MRANNLPVPEGVVVTKRDMDLLCDLLCYGAMLPVHLQALFFPGCSRRRMNQRLRQLCDAGLILRRPMPLGLSGGLPSADAPGCLPQVYRLGGAGSSPVAARLGWDVADVRRLVRAGTPTAIAHTLQIVSLRIQAEREVQKRGEAGATELVHLEFLPERLIRHGYQIRTPGGRWREEVYKPDALLQFGFETGTKFEIGSGIKKDCKIFCFAEVDLGHTSAAEWKKKVEIAFRYRRSGLFQKRYGADGFLTLICTTGGRRLANLQRLLEASLEAEDAATFGVATLTDIAAHGPLNADWHIPGQVAPLSLEAWADRLGFT